MAFEPHADERPAELPDVPADHDGLAPRQRGSRTDPSMRDGDSSHGNPYEMEGSDVTTDNDTGDMGDEPVRAGFDGGAAEGTPADLRGDADTDADDFTLRGGSRDLHIGGGDEADEDLDDEAMTDTPPAVTDPLPHPNVDAGADGSTVGRNEPPRRAGAPPAARDEDTAEVDLPIARYSDLTVKEVGEKAAALAPDDLRRVRAFEARHRNRKTLLARLDRLIKSAG
jgi:hypothetical protein